MAVVIGGGCVRVKCTPVRMTRRLNIMPSVGDDCCLVCFIVFLDSRMQLHRVVGDVVIESVLVFPFNFWW